MHISLNRVFSILLAGAFFVQLVFTVACNTLNTDEEYHTFERYKLFEPSGIAQIPNTTDYIVIDDKDPYLSIFSLQYNKLSQISKPAIEFECEDKNCKDNKVKVKKLEGVTASLNNPGTFYAITAFARKKPGEKDDKRETLVRFVLNKSTDAEYKHNEVPYKIVELEELEISDPYEAITYEGKPTPWLKVEGLALTPDEKHLLVGVRAIGKSKKNPEYRVIILKYDINELDKLPDVIVNVDLANVTGRPEGISSLEYDPDSGKYIVLTSYEVEEGKSKEQVGGHLWLVPENFEGLNDADNWAIYKITSFTHKPEGVSLTSKPGEAIVVFDDDNDRKCINECTGKFNYKPNEGVFKIVNLNSGD